MRGYKVSVIQDFGIETTEQIFINYDKAVQFWNDTVRKTIKEKDCITEEFGEEIQSWKENKLKPFFPEDKDRYEFLYAIAPIIVYRDNKHNAQIAEVFYSYRCSYEYDEWDVGTAEVILKEIKLIE